MNKKLTERIGEQNKNYQNLNMVISKYENKNNITVIFEDGFSRITTYNNFKNGSVKNLYFPEVYGKGYIGEGEYKSGTYIYYVWKDMLKRCYKNPTPAYKDCEVCDEWLNFQNFAKWYNNNYYDIDEVLNLDKDILGNNKIYSPENCLIVPKRINSFFIKQKNKIYNLPSGITYDKSRNKICSQISYNGKHYVLGYFDSEKKHYLNIKIVKILCIKI